MLLLGLSMYSLLLADSASLTDLSAAYYALAVEGAVFSVLVLVLFFVLISGFGWVLSQI